MKFFERVEAARVAKARTALRQRVVRKLAEERDQHGNSERAVALELVLDELEQRPGPHNGVCVKCGCTDDFACDEGCAWANADHTLCTSCVQQKGLT